MAGLPCFTAPVLDISRWSSSYWTMGQMPTASKEESVISFLKRYLISDMEAASWLMNAFEHGQGADTCFCFPSYTLRSMAHC